MDEIQVTHFGIKFVVEYHTTDSPHVTPPPVRLVTLEEIYLISDPAKQNLLDMLSIETTNTFKSLISDVIN